MEHSHYTISQAAQVLQVKESVLRYWEEELNLRVRRNEQGHRYYTGYDIQLFMNIKELKKKGLQLRAIREFIPSIALKAPGSTESKIKLLPMEGMGKEQESQEQTEEKQEHREKIVAFQAIVEKLLEQGLREKEEGEHRYRSLDETIRRHQLARRETAAAAEGGSRRRKR